MAGSWPLETEVEIHTFDIDFAGHVSNIVYVRWLEVARTRLLDAVGLPVPALLDEGLAPVVARTEIDYKRPLRLGEPVRIGLGIAKLRSLSAFLAVEVATGDEVAAVARQLGLFVSTETGRPRRLTPELRARFEPYVLADPV